MEAVESCPCPSSSTIITDLTEDSLAHCANFLSRHDLSSFATSSKYLFRVAYSDSVWHRLFRERWPHVTTSNFPANSRVRDSYLARDAAVRHFSFDNPSVLDFYTDAKPLFDHIILDGDDILFSQGSSIERIRTSNFLNDKDARTTLRDHRARITCMRVYSLDDTTYRSETQRKQRALVTSSCDHTIRLWWKGSCRRCLRGHNGPVTCLSDRLLGDGSAKVLASGGEDGTVRLWSLSSTGKRGQQALKATLYGHEKPIKQMSVAEHNTSLLVTISNDSKVRVWDASTSTAVRSSCCLGMISVPGAPVDMKLYESLLYVASGSSVVTIDLRTMQKVGVPAVYRSNLFSFAMVPSKPMFCTGAMGKGMLWDMRRNQETIKPEPVAELDGHIGPITQLHADGYKIVAGGPEDNRVNVWEADNGTQTNSLMCCGSEDPESASSGCMAMAVDGTRIVTAGTSSEEYGLIRFRDFLHATAPVSRAPDEDNSSKFWDQSDRRQRY